eukprot:3298503-Pleurochrysis_carterae.AAC.1
MQQRRHFQRTTRCSSAARSRTESSPFTPETNRPRIPQPAIRPISRDLSKGEQAHTGAELAACEVDDERHARDAPHGNAQRRRAWQS